MTLHPTPLKVLHVYKDSDPARGGVAKFIAELASKTATEPAIQHTLLSIGDPPSTEGHNILKTLPNLDVQIIKPLLSVAGTPISLDAIGTFYKHCKKMDLIHYHFPYPFADLLQFALRPKKPYLVTYHSDIVKQKGLLQLYKPLQHWFLKRAAAIVATSPPYVKTSPVLQKFPATTQVIPLGLSDTAQKNLSPQTALQKHSLPERFFLYVGAFRYYKGLHTLLEAAEKTSVPIVLAGRGDLLESLKNKATQKKLSHLHFLGGVSEEEKNALLSTCRAFIFPSHLRSEAFGLSLVEASMYEKPMISCDIGTGTSFINLHEKTGLNIPPERPEALAQAIDFLWNNPEKADQMGRAARVRYELNFTANAMGKAYTALYQKVLKSAS